MRIGERLFLTRWLVTGASAALVGAVACGDEGSLGQGAPKSESAPTEPMPTDGAPEEVVEGDVVSSRTLSKDRTWLLKGLVSVKAGAVLTIEKGTVIKGDNASKAILLIESGAKIIAEGTKDEPIVFTSQARPGEKQPGQWGGLILLGKAPVNLRDASGNPVLGNVEGILKAGSNSGTTYGGTDENDSSGILRYVRVEYSGVVISTDNEVNGITFAGVGRGTVVDHVQVRQTLDDCFEFFGGTVDAKYLACQGNEDDGFDFDLGYRGRLQYLVLQQDPAHEGDDNGFESDNDDKSTANAPVTSPTVYNATICGKNVSVGGQQYGLLLRRNTQGTYRNLVVVGFQAGLEVRDAVTSPNSLVVGNSLFWGSTGAPGYSVADQIAFVEDKSGVPSGEDEKKYKARLDWDDDFGFDEVKMVKTLSNRVADPQIAGCFDAKRPSFGPASSLVEQAAQPPADGFFDPAATYMGAFRDANDAWATTGSWAVWDDR